MLTSPPVNTYLTLVNTSVKSRVCCQPVPVYEYEKKRTEAAKAEAAQAAKLKVQAGCTVVGVSTPPHACSGGDGDSEMGDVGG